MSGLCIDPARGSAAQCARAGPPERTSAKAILRRPAPPSTSGPGLHPFKVAARVRIPSGVLVRRALAAGVAGLAFASPASATPPSTSFKITGYEYAFTSTVGSFAGRGVGNVRDTGFWNATVTHDRLGATSAFVNGGTFVITVKKASGGLDAIAGTFTHHGGTITTLKPGTNCTNQQYRVSAKLEDVL